MTERSEFRHFGAGTKGLFLLLRYVFIIAAAYLVIFQGAGEIGASQVVMIAVALASNLALSRLSPQSLFAWYVEAPVLIADTLWVSWALHSTGAVGQEFFLLYFFVLFLSATTNRLVIVLVGAVSISAANVYFISADAWTTTPNLLRIAFFFTVALFYSHVLREIRRERLRADTGFAWARELEAKVAERTAGLRKLYERSRAASAAKSDFVASMSHELRTPLNIIIGYADMLLDETAPAKPQRPELILQRVRGAAANLLTLVNSVLDLGKLESGKMPIAMQPVFVDRLAAELQQREHVAAAPGVTLRWEIPATLPIIETDPEKLTIVLDNLINNAIKFTSSGVVKVSFRDFPDERAMEFEVTDTGIGIESAQLTTIFDPFHQTEAGRDRGGVGLGLSIVKSYIELLGGAVEVRSAVGEGSSFVVRLPHRWSVARGEAEHVAPVARTTSLGALPA
jgi:signal transduction histidine kinase